MPEILNSTNPDKELNNNSNDGAANLDSQINYLVETINKDLKSISDNNKNMLAGNPSELTGFEIEEAEKRLIRNINSIIFVISAVLPILLKNGFKVGSSISLKILSEFIENPATIGLDSKALQLLIKDSLNDIILGLGESKKIIKKYFKMTKQLKVYEEDIVSSIATGASKKNPLWGARKELMKLFNDKLGNGQLIPVRCIRKDGTNYIAYWKPDKYSQLVARTRIGEAQVLGAIETSEENGTYTFTVTSHNTKTAICAPHEGKTYTTDPRLISWGVFPSLDGNRPLYHPNCQHRLIPSYLSQKALERKVGKLNSDLYFSGK
jgi:hypothetical protein